MGRSSASIVLYCLASAPGVSAAQELDLAVESQCADAPVAAEVEAALGRALGPGPAVVRARVALRRNGSAVRAVIGIERDGARSERRLDARDYRSAARAAAIVITLALDAEATAPRDGPAPGAGGDAEAASGAPVPPDGDGSEPAASIDAAATSSEPTGAALTAVDARGVETGPTGAEAQGSLASAGGADAVHERPLLFTVDIGARLDAGSLPGWSPGVTGSVGIGFGPRSIARIELGAAYVTPARARSGAPGATVRVGLTTAVLRAAALVPIARWLAAGGGLELEIGAGSGAARGLRVQDGSSERLPWLALRAGALVELTLAGPFRLRGSGSIGVPLVAPVFVIEGAGAVRPSSRVVGSLVLSLVMELS